MKKGLVIFVMVLFSVIITACASSAEKAAEMNEKMAQDIQGYELPVKPTDSTAVVYTVRQSKMAGSIIPFKISIDGSPEILKNGTAVVYVIKPGSHSFKANSENQDEILFTAEAGQVYFFEVTAKMGVFVAQAAANPVDGIVGTWLVKKYYDANTRVINLEDYQRPEENQSSPEAE